VGGSETLTNLRLACLTRLATLAKGWGVMFGFVPG
jgi:hypothetical protein